MKAIMRKPFFIILAMLLPAAAFGQVPDPEETQRAQQRVVLEQIHTREMTRLNAIKKVAEQRESEGLKKKIDGLIAEAQARHAKALKTLEEPKPQAEEEAETADGA